MSPSSLERAVLERILHALLDRYERSAHYRGEARTHRRVLLPVQEATVPELFDERSSRPREAVLSVVQDLARRGVVTPIYKRGYEGQVLDRLALNLDRVEETYRLVGRRPRAEQDQAALELVRSMRRTDPPWLARFYDHLEERLAARRLAAPYVKPDRPDENRLFLTALNALATLEEETSKALFSARHLGSHKAFRSLEPRLVQALQSFAARPDAADLDPKELLAEHHLVDGPQFLYLSGDLTFRSPGLSAQLHRGESLGISSRAARDGQIQTVQADYLITVENLNAFHHFVGHSRDRYLAVYLGGYHNRLRRDFLIRLRAALPEGTPALHWGDIDLGGFRILAHLRRETGIPFEPLWMDEATLRQHARYATPLTDSYRKQLHQAREDPQLLPFRPVLDAMLQTNRRLEQEAVEVPEHLALPDESGP